MKELFSEIFTIAWPTVVIILSIAVILRIFYLKQNKKKFVFHQEFILLLFLTYILVLFELLTHQDMSTLETKTNFIPFREILRYDFGTYGFYRQVIGNIILFIPFGFFVSKYIKVNKIGSMFIVSFFASTVIETVQYYIGRCFDIDDIILNVTGGILGFLLFIGLDAIRKKLPGLFQKDIIYNILSLLFVVIVVLYFLGMFTF